MPNKDHEIGTLLDLVMEIDGMARKHSGGGKWDAAMLAWRIIAPDGEMLDTAKPSYMKDCCRLALRIQAVMPGIDEPRFSMEDYADAVAHATVPVDVRKLVYLEDDEAFAKAMAWLAAYKRETYEDRVHEEEPEDLGIDVWEDRT